MAEKSVAIGVVCAGPFHRTGLARLTGIRDKVVWVKSRTVSAATRAARAVGGRAARAYEDLADVSVVFIKAPDACAPQIVAELAGASLDWHSVTVALFESGLDSAALESLAAKGAWIASATPVSWPPGAVLLEGDVRAVRELRRLFRSSGAPVVEIRKGGRTDYTAGVELGSFRVLLLLTEAIARFEAAGMEKAAAARTAASLFESSLRAYFRAGRRLLAPRRSVSPQA